MTIEIAYQKYKTQEDCIKYLEDIFWSGKPFCPYCQSRKQTAMPREKRYHCNMCLSSYSVTVRTPFHKTKVALQKWFAAIPLILNDRITARGLAKKIEVTKDTACFMINRIKVANNDQPEIIKYFLTA